MGKITIDDLKNHLLDFQANMECQGEVSILKECSLPPALCDTLSINPQAKMIFAYIGVDNYRDNSYLAWLENEGGILVNMTLDPHGYVKDGLELIITENGHIGFGQTISMPTKMEIIWDNNRPQVKITKTGEIIEITDVPKEAPMETHYKLYQNNLFSLTNLLFGNPNIFYNCPTDIEHSMLYMKPTGEIAICLHDDFTLDMDEHGAELKGIIANIGDSNLNKLEDAIREFVEQCN